MTAKHLLSGVVASTTGALQVGAAIVARRAEGIARVLEAVALAVVEELLVDLAVLRHILGVQLLVSLGLRRADLGRFRRGLLTKELFGLALRRRELFGIAPCCVQEFRLLGRELANGLLLLLLLLLLGM